MNQKTAKLLRRYVDNNESSRQYPDEIRRGLYRNLKKTYNALPQHQRFKYKKGLTWQPNLTNTINSNS